MNLFAIFIIMSSLTLAGYIVRLLCRMVMSEQKKFKEKMMRDEFLTEAMGECWHEEGRKLGYCGTCGCGVPIKRANTTLPAKYKNRSCISNQDFSTWDGFGKLWEWAPKQEWWKEFNVFANNHCDYEMDIQFVEMFGNLIPNELINPDRFSTAVYEFLKERHG